MSAIVSDMERLKDEFFEGVASGKYLLTRDALVLCINCGNCYIMADGMGPGCPRCEPEVNND